VSVTAAAGFVAAGIAAGIKESGAADLSLVASASGAPVAAAGVFTSNKMTAAPVIVTNRHLEATGGTFGFQTMCEGGGQANATVIERL